MQLTVQYSAPLPVGFQSGSVTLTYQRTYIDKDGRVTQPIYRAILNSDKGLSSVQGGAQLQIVGMGQGDPVGAGLVDVKVSMVVTGFPTPLQSTFQVIPLDTGGGTLNLHEPNRNVPAVGPLPASLQALIDQATASQATLADLITQSGSNLALITFVLASYPQVVQQAQAVLQTVYENAALLGGPVLRDYTERDAYFASLRWLLHHPERSPRLVPPGGHRQRRGPEQPGLPDRRPHHPSHGNQQQAPATPRPTGHHPAR